MDATVVRSSRWIAWASRLAGCQDPLAGLMTCYQAGDADAFRRLHARLRPAVGAFLRSRGVAEDCLDPLLDDVFLAMHAARRSWGPAVPVDSWAEAIAARVLTTGRRPVL